jgi:hypothetical protein
MNNPHKIIQNLVFTYYQQFIIVGTLMDRMLCFFLKEALTALEANFNFPPQYLTFN